MKNGSKRIAIIKILCLFSLLAIIAFSFITCEGPAGAVGPEGPVGPQGDPGPTGPEGVGIVWQGELAAAPAEPEPGWTYFDTAAGNAYIYFETGWQMLAQGGADGSDGVSINWQGTHSSHPTTPQVNWAYYNDTSYQSFIYNGVSWQVLTKDGAPGGTGPQGLAPYIGNNCNWWVGGNDTGVFAGHKDFDGVICKVCGNIEGMVALKGGTFIMGQGDILVATPVRSVTVSGFKMARYQVTQELYFTVMENNPSEFNGTTGKESAAGEIQGKRPVEMVSWRNAVEFCNKLSERGGLTPVYNITVLTVTANWNANGYRLPTEAEWEYACRAGTATQWSFGATSTAINNYAWYTTNSSPTGLAADRRTHQVGLKLPNAFGLYDMHGNVQEWCWDRNDSYQIGDTDNPRGSENTAYPYRVRRGGSWSNTAMDTRSANRSSGSLDAYNNVGFRLVRR